MHPETFGMSLVHDAPFDDAGRIGVSIRVDIDAVIADLKSTFAIWYTRDGEPQEK
jgi:hypothetical protein